MTLEASWSCGEYDRRSSATATRYDVSQLYAACQSTLSINGDIVS